MAEIKITQQMIDYYRSKPGNAVLLDSAIIDLINKDIETGKLPKEFATLASDAQKTGYNVTSSNLFGYGFDTNTDIGLTFERTTVPDNKPEIKADQPLTLGDFVEDLDKKSISEAKREKIYIKPFSEENFIEEVGLDINNPDGEKILDRISSISPYFEIYEISVDGKDIKQVLESNSLEPTFDNISSVMEILYRVTLRNEEEYNDSEEQRKTILMQLQAANIMEHFFSLSAQWNDQYTDGLGLFGLGSEGIGYIINKLGLDGENHFQWADSCREWAERAGKLSVLNPEKFQEEFKKIYSDDGKYGIEFDEEAFINLLELVKQDKIFDKDGEITQEGKDAILKAFNFVLDNPNESTYNQVMNGFGEALIMIATLGWGATTKGGQMLATTSMATFSKAGVAIASKSVNSKLLQGALRFTGKGVKLLGPAVNEGTKLAMYTMASGTTANATNRIVNADSEENSWEKFLQTEAMVMEGAKGSFAFGAFAGVFGSTVTQAVVQRVSKVSSKVTTALTDKFAKGAVDANEVFSTYLAKSVPTGALEKATVEFAAYVTDVVGFTAFETAIALFKQVKNLPENEQPQKFTEILWGHFKDQGYNLGQIKIVSHLVMWMSGSRGARMASTEYLKQNLPQLNGETVEQIGKGYKIKLRSGTVVECKNSTEMLSSLNLMVRGETYLSAKFNKNNDLSKIEIKELNDILCWYEKQDADFFLLKTKELVNKYNDKNIYQIIKNLFSKNFEGKENDLRFFMQQIENNKINKENIFEIIKNTKPENIKEINILFPRIINLEPSLYKNIFNIIEAIKTPEKIYTMEMKEVQNLLNEIEKTPNDILKDFDLNGYDIFDFKNKLNHYLSINNQIDLGQKRVNLYKFIANNKKSATDIFNTAELRDCLNKYNKTGLPLKYSREAFLFDFDNLIEKLPEREQKLLLDELEFSQNNFPQLKNIDIRKFDIKNQENIVEILHILKQFYLENGIETDNVKINSELNLLLEGFPEFIQFIGKRDGVHENTIDIHTLEVLSNALENPKINSLSDQGKIILKLSILLHDIGKEIGRNDEGLHSRSSAFLANKFLKNYKLSQNSFDDIINLIKHHHFAQEENNNFSEYFRGEEQANIARIFYQADYKARFGIEPNVEQYVSKYQPQPLMVSRNTVALEKFPKQTEIIGNKEIELSILDISNMSPETDMTSYGYYGLKLKEITGLVHFADSPEKFERILKMYNDPNYDFCLSAMVRKFVNLNEDFMRMGADNMNYGGKIAAVLTTSEANSGGGNSLKITSSGFFKRLIDFNRLNDQFFYFNGTNFTNQEKIELNKYFSKIKYPEQIKENLEINGRTFTVEDLKQIWKQEVEISVNSTANEKYAYRPNISLFLIQGEIPLQIKLLSDEYKIPIIKY